LSLSAAAKENEYSVNESIERNDMYMDNDDDENNDDEDHNESNMLEEVDVCIIGSGLGGLCAAAILNTLYDKTVAVYESHDVAGGCAHAFTRRSKSGVAFTFDSGLTILLGCSSPPLNALQQVLQAIGQDKAVE
jgi:predicted NAD/FAD-binding protein